MIFNQPAYFVFLAASVLTFRFLPPRAKPWWLFATGLVFYAYFSPAFVAILAVEVLLVFAFGRMVSNERSGRLWFAVAVTSVLAVLVVYKYAGLLAATFTNDRVTGLPGFEDLRLPLAISFFTFEFVHYLIEVRRGSLPKHSLADFLGFAMFVPTMVAGPIKRFAGFSEQVAQASAKADDVDAGVRRILVGLLKKMVFADTFTLWTAPLASADGLGSATRLDIAVALVAYSLRIYLDFSAYSDIAIGSARLFGIRVPENFAWPYLKRNITQFWRSWHISLTSWIRDYVYIPLGGNRKGDVRTYANLIVAMAVSGMWHGAGWNFLAWGLYHGALLAAHRLWTRAGAAGLLRRMPSRRKALPDPGTATLAGAVGGAAGGALTFAFVTFGWALFAMPLDRFVQMISLLFGGAA